MIITFRDGCTVVDKGPAVCVIGNVAINVGAQTTIEFGLILTGNAAEGIVDSVALEISIVDADALTST